MAQFQAIRAQMDACARRTAIGTGALAGLAVYVGLGRWSSMAKIRRCLVAALASIGAYAGARHVVPSIQKRFAMHAMRAGIQRIALQGRIRRQQRLQLDRVAQALEPLPSAAKILTENSACPYEFVIPTAQFETEGTFSLNKKQPVNVKCKLKSQGENGWKTFPITWDTMINASWADDEMAAILVWDANSQQQHISHDTLWKWRVAQLQQALPGGFACAASGGEALEKVPVERLRQAILSGKSRAKIVHVIKVNPQAEPGTPFAKKIAPGTKPWRLTFADLRSISPGKIQNLLKEGERFPPDLPHYDVDEYLEKATAPLRQAAAKSRQGGQPRKRQRVPKAQAKLPSQLKPLLPLLGAYRRLNEDSTCSYQFQVDPKQFKKGKQIVLGSQQPVNVQCKLKREGKDQWTTFALNQIDIVPEGTLLTGAMEATLVWNANLVLGNHTNHDTLWKWRANELNQRLPEGYLAALNPMLAKSKVSNLLRDLKKPDSKIHKVTAMTIIKVNPQADSQAKFVEKVAPGTKPRELTFSDLRWMSPQALDFLLPGPHPLVVPR